MDSTRANDFLEPVKLFENELKETRFSKSKTKFDEFVATSQTDEAQNIATVEEYEKKIAESKAAGKALSKTKGKRGFLIFLIVVLFIAAFIFLLSFITAVQTGSLMSILWCFLLLSCLAGGILLIVDIKKRVNAEVDEKNSIKAKIDAEAEVLRKKALSQVAALKKLMTYDSQIDVLNQLIEVIHFSKSFDESTFEYMDDKFGISAIDEDKNSSVVGLMSGTIYQNPFVLLTQKSMNLFDKTYEGSLEITWVTYSHDSQGNTITEHHSQTLRATVTAPCPAYGLSTVLLYGNDAAPDLSFSRAPSGLSVNWTDREVASMVKSRSKALQKKAKEAIKKGTSYTALGDDDFEALFGGENRDNEVEFRLLFTPLAQRSLLSLIKSREPYGDDFTLQKSHKLNLVWAAHQLAGRYEVNPTDFAPMISVKELREYYVQNTALLFTSIYFTFAPLLCIPLYTQYMGDYVQKDPKLWKSHISPFEQELHANLFPKYELCHKETATDCIVKTELTEKLPNCDVLEVTTRSFSATPRTTYVSVHGGDGYYHDVPVNWIEYKPLKRSVPLSMSPCKSQDDLANNLKNAGLGDSAFQFNQNLLLVKPKPSVSLDDLDDFYAKLVPPDLR